MRIIVFLAGLLFAAPVWAATPINSPGSYETGDYYLSADISVSSGDALIFTGAATLDLNGHTISTSQTGNTWDYGVRMQGAGSAITDSVGTGQITGFRVGVKFTGAGSSSTGINYSGNRYMGVWITADDVTITGGEISDIGGVTDEKYAIGVQVAGDGAVVDGVSFTNLYPQAEYTGSEVGEGLAVNLSAASANGIVQDINLSNGEFVQDTMGIFVGSGGGHVVDGAGFHNIFRPVQVAQTGPASTVTNTSATWTHNPPSLSVGDASALEGETVVFTVSLAGGAADTVTVDYSTSDGTAIAGQDFTAESGTLTFAPGETTKTIEIATSDDAVEEGAETFTVTLSNPSGPAITDAVGVGTIQASDAPNGEGAILDQALDVNFGNITGKTARVEIKASALTVPSGTPSRIRITLNATGDEPFSVGAAFVGHKAASGDPWDATALSQLLVGGQGGFTVPTGGSVTTDWLDFAWDRSSDLILSLYCDGDASADKMPAKSGTTHATHLKSGDEAGQADVSGYYSYAGYLSAVGRIETDGF